MILSIFHLPGEIDSQKQSETRKWVRQNAEVVWEFSWGIDFQIKDEKKIAWAMLKYGAVEHKTWKIKAK